MAGWAPSSGAASDGQPRSAGVPPASSDASEIAENALTVTPATDSFSASQITRAKSSLSARAALKISESAGTEARFRVIRNYWKLFFHLESSIRSLGLSPPRPHCVTRPFFRPADWCRLVKRLGGASPRATLISALTWGSSSVARAWRSAALAVGWSSWPRAQAA